MPILYVGPISNVPLTIRCPSSSTATLHHTRAAPPGLQHIKFPRVRQEGIQGKPRLQVEPVDVGDTRSLGGASLVTVRMEGYKRAQSTTAIRAERKSKQRGRIPESSAMHSEHD
jgi:hypothetical protein